MGFDYVIVGGGSAGCVLANRLSQNPAHSVCLIEAGPKDDSLLIRTPIGFAGMIGKEEFDWCYHTEPEAELNNRQILWPRGKTLGGSSSINAMVYIRGHQSDYDEWSSLGNPGWRHKDLLPYFKKSMNQERGESEYHGTGGPLNVADLNCVNPLSNSFVRASVQAGQPYNYDFNGAEQEGCGLFQVTQKDGERCNTSRAYLSNIENRVNLTIKTGTVASRIQFQGKKASSLVVIENGIEEEIEINKEILLCGGAINSPQLLLLSGIGPAEELEQHNINMVHNLPGVGKNLQDHLDVTLVQRCGQSVSFGRSMKYLLNNALAPLNYYLNRKGPLSSNVSEAGGFAKTDPSLDRPDLQFHFLPVSMVDKAAEHGYSLHTCQLRPKSRGEITLHSSDPAAPAKIHANYLSDRSDLDVLIKGVKIAQSILQQKEFDFYRSGYLSPPQEFNNDADIESFIRSEASTIFHPVGTCKMGKDDMAVVNSRNLKVKTISNLRVIDASIMPTLVGGNTNAPTVAIAEKGADLILKDNA